MGDLIKVAIIDDHRALTDALTILLDKEGSFIVTSIANDMSAAKVIATQDEHDVYLVDLNINHSDSYTLIELISKNNKPVVVFSTYADYGHIKKATKAGAQAYLSKTSESIHITNALKAVYFGNCYFDQIIQRSINESLTLTGASLARPKVSQARPKVILSELTRREKDVMSLIIQEYTSQEIAKELHLSKNTVDGYRKEIISKLGVKNSVGIANTYHKYLDQIMTL